MDCVVITCDADDTVPDIQHFQPIIAASSGVLKVSHTLDTFVDGNIDMSKDNLEGKKLVLFFGSEANPLTRNFYKPKLAMIYHYMTLECNGDIEFIYVSRDKTQVAFDRFTKSHRKLR